MHRLARTLAAWTLILWLGFWFGVGWALPASAQADELDCIDFEFQEDAQAELDADPSDPNNLDTGDDGIACALLPSRAAETGGADATPAPAGDDALDAAPTDESESPAANDGGGDAAARRQEREARRLARQQEREAAAEETPAAEENGGGNAGDRQRNRNRDRNRDQDAGQSPVCDDFATQEEAQAAVDDDPEGSVDLDNNGDGFACFEGDDQPLPSEADAGTGGLFVCADFLTQEEAQAAFDDDPENLIDLDTNGDGLACAEGDDEPLPEEEPVNEVTAGDLDCIDFQFQEEAQAELDADPSDPFNLDPSADGFACSELPSEDGTVRVTTMPTTGTGDAWHAGNVGAAMTLVTAMLVGAAAWCLRHGTDAIDAP